MTTGILSSIIPANRSILSGKAVFHTYEGVRKELMDTREYRQSEYFERNREIWKYRFEKNWSWKDLSGYFGMSVEEVKEAVARQKMYFEEEYA